MLKQIFDTITPEHIKDTKLIKDSMEIFIENIEKQSKVSIDISEVFSAEQESIKEELVNIYLDDLYRVFKKAASSPQIRKKIEFESSTYGGLDDSDLLQDIVQKLDAEYFVTSKHFKEKKGTKVGIEYIYNLADSLGFSFSGSAPFKFTPGVEDPGNPGTVIPAPFQFRVEGSLYKEVYEEIVKPLSHPLGFTYVYFQILIQSLQDYFKLDITYKNEVVEVVCLSGYIDVYSMKETTEEEYKDNFLQKINPQTQLNYTEEEFYEYVTFMDDGLGNELVVESITDIDDESGKFTEVHFTNNTYIAQTYDPTAVKVWNDGANTGVDTPIKDYTGLGKHCSMSLSYDVEFHSTIQDVIDCQDNQHLMDIYKVSVETCNAHFDFTTEEEIAYIPDTPYIGFIVGDTVIGSGQQNNIIGLEGDPYVGSINRTATDLYIMQNEVEDYFYAELI